MQEADIVRLKQEYRQALSRELDLQHRLEKLERLMDMVLKKIMQRKPVDESEIYKHEKRNVDKRPLHYYWEKQDYR